MVSDLQKDGLKARTDIAPKSLEPWRRLPSLAGLPYEGLLTNHGRIRPLYLRIETVNTCNNHCVICAYRDQERAKEIMAADVFEKAVRDYVALGGGFLSFTPLVGEFFLDRYLVERLKFLEGIPEITELGVTTNGSMVHRFNDEELTYILGRFSRVSISVYGIDADEYERMTGRKTYLKMVEGMRRILTMSPNRVSLEFRLLNKRSDETLFNWLQTEVLPGLDAATITSKARINSAITHYANWGIYDERSTPLPGDARWFASERHESRVQCLIPIFACMVFSNGNVSFCPCDNFNDTPELRLGNIRERSLAELYNSTRALKLWNWTTHGTPDFCKNCSFHIPLDTLQKNPSILADPHQIVGAG